MRLLPLLTVAIFAAFVLNEFHATAQQGPPVPRAKPRPFAVLQAQIDALQTEVETLTARTVGLRVFDGEGNDVGLYAGRDGSIPTAEVIHVFFEDLGVTATYNAGGQLIPLEKTRLAFASDDCQGQAFHDVAGIAGSFFEGGAVGVLLTGTVTEEVLVASRIRNVGPRGEPICESFIRFVTRVPVEFFDPAEIGIATQIPPLPFVAAAK